MDGVTSVKAVRLENFAYKDWFPAFYQQVTHRYPNAKPYHQNPSVVVIPLGLTSPWGSEDEEFFGALKERACFQRWETLSEVPPRPKANAAIYEDVGYRVATGARLTAAQQEKLLSQLNDLELRVQVAERDAEEQRRRAERSEYDCGRRAQEYNHLIAVLAGINDELNITINGDYQGNCSVEDKATGRVLLRDTPFIDVYHMMFQLRTTKK